MYLLSLLLPAPMLALASFQLRYRVPSTSLSKKGSAQSTSTHRSLALMSESQLSLPISVSPKLTPPVAQRSSTGPAQLSKLLDPKPSISNFGYNRRHTVDAPVSVYEIAAEEAKRRTLARRSGDVWIEAGHAIEGGGLLARATEMLKPVPAMRVLSDASRGPGVFTRLRGGVVSMLPIRSSGYGEHSVHDPEYGGAQDSPIRISITSPSEFERRRSQAASSTSDEPEVDSILPSAEIQTAIQARVSASPTYCYIRPDNGPGPSGGYGVDWLTAGILPK